MWNPVQLAKLAKEEVRPQSLETWGRNWGPIVSKYQSSTGAYRAPWCVSFAQWCLKQVGAGPIFGRTAGVFYLVAQARKVGWLYSYPKLGDLVAYLHGSGHMGVVVSVHVSGSFDAVEGNASDGVRFRSYTKASAGSHVFVRIPGSHIPKAKTVWLPRFEIVASQNGTTKVVMPWGKWSAIQLRVPSVVAKYGAARIRRKLVKKKIMV